MIIIRLRGRPRQTSSFQYASAARHCRGVKRPRGSSSTSQSYASAGARCGPSVSSSTFDPRAVGRSRRDRSAGIGRRRTTCAGAPCASRQALSPADAGTATSKGGRSPLTPRCWTRTARVELSMATGRAHVASLMSRRPLLRNSARTRPAGHGTQPRLAEEMNRLRCRQLACAPW